MNDEFLDIFNKIVSEWKKQLNNDKDKDMFRWKVLHSYRVALLSLEIAKNIKYDYLIDGMESYLEYDKNNNKYIFNAKGIYLATIIGLFHDIGRFPQIVIYHTETDSKSIDHGTLGYIELKTNDLLDNTSLTKQDINIVYESIKNHNKYKVDNLLTNDVKEFCNIVRDADKIDIIKGFSEGSINLIENKNVNLSDEVVDDLINNEMIKFKHVKNENDHIAVMFSYYFDIATTSAKDLIDKDNIFIKLYDRLENKEIFKVLKKTKIMKRGNINVR